MLAVLGMLLGGTLFHEFGHAAGCRYGGGRPGVIGVGVYVILPAFYTNVTDAYRLDRAGRLRTDLGGIYFNAIAALVFGVGYLATGWVPLLLAAFLMHLEALQQCLPLIRSDGYFILADLVGVPDLFGRIRPVLASLLPWRKAGPRVRELRPTGTGGDQRLGARGGAGTGRGDGLPDSADPVHRRLRGVLRAGLLADTPGLGRPPGAWASVILAGLLHPAADRTMAGLSRVPVPSGGPDRCAWVSGCPRPGTARAMARGRHSIVAVGLRMSAENWPAPGVRDVLGPKCV